MIELGPCLSSSCNMSRMPIDSDDIWRCKSESIIRPTAAPPLGCLGCFVSHLVVIGTCCINCYLLHCFKWYRYLLDCFRTTGNENIWHSASACFVIITLFQCLLCLISKTIIIAFVISSIIIHSFGGCGLRRRLCGDGLRGRLRGGLGLRRGLGLRGSFR